jgi:hypothetical protein
LKNIGLKDLSPEMVKRFRDHSKNVDLNYEFVKKIPLGGELANVYISFKNLIIEREKQT